MQEKHGYSSTSHPYFRVYTAWCTMKSRCYREKDKNFKRYGFRGINVCDRWLNSFINFLEDMGVSENGQSLDRIDVNGNYCKENCRWANKETQSNNCRTNTYYEFNGELLSETQWSRKLGLTRNKFMNWVRKHGICWVIENLEFVKKARRGMTDKEYGKNDSNKRRTKHGALKLGSELLKTHNAHRGLKERCKKNNVKCWEKFEDFLNDMGQKPEGKRLLRKNKNESFSKENCYWG